MHTTWIINYKNIRLNGFPLRAEGEVAQGCGDGNVVYTFPRMVDGKTMPWMFLESDMEAAPDIFIRVCGWCKSLLSDKQTCAALRGGVYCTRESGHTGPHVACSTGDPLTVEGAHPCLVWTEQEKDKNPNLDFPDPEGRIDDRPVLAHATPTRCTDPLEVRVLCQDKTQAGRVYDLVHMALYAARAGFTIKKEN